MTMKLTKQDRLIAAIRTAMAEQGFDQKRLAEAAGMARSMLNSALQGKYALKELRWRALCEVLALDYDAITEEPAVDFDAIAEAVLAAPEPGPVIFEEPEPEALTEPAEIDVTPVAQPGSLEIVARYVAGKLREDIRRGTDMTLQELRVLLDVAGMGGCCG